MNNEKLRTEYSIFSIQYKNINKHAYNRHKNCGLKKLENIKKKLEN